MGRLRWTAGYTIQTCDGDWFISLINIMMRCVCLFGKVDLSDRTMAGLCLAFFILMVAQSDDVLCLW